MGQIWGRFASGGIGQVVDHHEAELFGIEPEALDPGWARSWRGGGP